MGLRLRPIPDQRPSRLRQREDSLGNRTVQDPMIPNATEMTAAAAESSITCLLSLKDIVKSYGPTLANSGIGLSIFPGDVIGLVGGNGAGKSTLMKIVCGGTFPDSGMITFSGREIDCTYYGPAA